MNLKKLLTSQGKAPEQEHFLALEIHESLIKSAVWKTESGEPSIVSIGSFELWDSEESLINGVDASLSSAAKDLINKPTKVILGLPEPWLEGDKIHSTKTNLIKRVLTELGLKPIGLVTSVQAIIHHLKKKEGVPPSAVLLEIYPDKVTVAVVKLGKIKAIEEVGRSGELNQDVQEGLTRLNLDQLPPRFILTNGSGLEEEQQQLLSYPWQDKLSFLHLPKVEVLPAEFSIEAIALAGGSEAVDASEPSAALESRNDDISSLGFSIEEIKRPEKPKTPKVVNEPLPPPKPKLNLVNKIINLLKTGLVSSSGKKKSVLIIIPSLLLIPVLPTIFYLALASAQVTISVKETPLSETVDIYFGEQAPSDGIALPVKLQSLTASVSESISTTGEALVGDKATGRIILFNGTDEQVTIKSGTEIKTDNLSFIIDSNVAVASKSANILGGTIELGKSEDISVTASNIGSKYNLSKETQLSVSNYSRSSIYAISKNDFSGGTSRTVKAVSQDDQEKLLQKASEKVISEINDKVKAQDSTLSSLPIGKVTYSKKNFSKQIGEEANELSLDLTGEVKVLLYSNSEVINQLGSKLVSRTNPGMKLLEDQTKLEVLPLLDQGTDTYKTQVNIKGSLVPLIDQDRYLSQLKGKPVNKLKNILETIPGYESVKIVIKPNIPFLSNYLPLNKNRVSLSIAASK